MFTECLQNETINWVDLFIFATLHFVVLEWNEFLIKVPKEHSPIEIICR